MNVGKVTVQTRRAPFLKHPLRNPGQSLHEHLQDTLFDRVLGWLMAAAMAALLAVLEWVKYLNPSTPHPLLYSAGALIVITLAFIRIRRHVEHGKRLRLAEDGEKVVGQALETLRERGYRILHDIPGDNFNVDHVLVGPGGVFTVETKTLRKPEKGRSEIVFSGEIVSVFGRPLKRDPIVQAKAQASWIGGKLRDYTARQWPVRPVVVFPGWYIKGNQNGDVWVLNENALLGFLDRTKPYLTAQDIALATETLSTLVRQNTSPRSK